MINFWGFPSFLRRGLERNVTIVILFPDESAKLVDLMSADVVPPFNGNLANKSAIAENGNQMDNDNG